MSDAKSRAAYRKWYKANRVAYNAKRKAARDAADPSIRDVAAAKQRTRRAQKPTSSTKDGKHYRKVGKATVEVFRITSTAEMIGRDPQMIRQWQKDGKIPPPTVPGAHRYYTRHQVDLLIEFAQLMDQVRYSPLVRAEAITSKSEEIKALWAGVKK